MIKVKSIRQVRPEDGEVWAIVRSLRYPSRGMKQVADLSPNPALFQAYLRWRNAGEWNYDKFRNAYAPAFARQLKSDPNARRLLNELWKRDREGQTVTLVCFCNDELLCHRSLVAGLLQSVGTNVQAQADYTWFKALYDQA